MAAASNKPSVKPLPGARSVGEFGSIIGFSLRAIIELRGTPRYFSEVLRQCGILITGSAALIVFMSMVYGAECGLFGTYFLKPLGAESYIGFFTAACGEREATPLLFGYMFAAKVGCGLVAEIGSMRIAEEIDALESVGISPMRYIVATRLAASLIFIPLVFIVALAFTSLGSYLAVVVQIQDISQGAWSTVHYASQTIADNLASLAKGMAMGVCIVLVGSYYGYRAGGGAAGVGSATARSMVVNLVLVHLINGVGSSLFFGGNAGLPIGG